MRKCDVCGESDGRVSHELNGFYVNTCCVPFVRNMANCNNRSMHDEILALIEYRNFPAENKTSF